MLMDLCHTCQDNRCRELETETPLPDWSPFAAPSDGEWQAVQRRRNLVRMVHMLADMARDDGLRTAATLLHETAELLRQRLILPGPAEA